MEKNKKKIGLLIFPNIITEQWGYREGRGKSQLCFLQEKIFDDLFMRNEIYFENAFAFYN